MTSKLETVAPIREERMLDGNLVYWQLHLLANAMREITPTNDRNIGMVSILDTVVALTWYSDLLEELCIKHKVETTLHKPFGPRYTNYHKYTIKSVETGRSL